MGISLFDYIHASLKHVTFSQTVLKQIFLNFMFETRDLFGKPEKVLKNLKNKEFRRANAKKPLSCNFLKCSPGFQNFFG